MTQRVKEKCYGSYKMKGKRIKQYDPDGGFWDYNLNMWIQYEDMELV